MTTLQTLLTGGGLTAMGVVLAALAANWLGERRDQRRYKHERAMAVEARRQERLEQAYIELLEYLAHNAGWARSVRSMVAIEAPDPLTSEKIQRVEALVAAYGSEEVRQLWGKWMQRMAGLAAANATVAEAETLNRRNRRSQQLDAETRKVLAAIPDYKEAVFKADTAIRQRVRQELAGEV